MKESYGTLSETINGLKKEGYTLDFNIKDDCLLCHENQKTLSPEEFEIDKVFRFEGESNPDDSSVLYAISAPNFNMKGTLVNGYGIYDDADSTKLVSKLKAHH